jgi:hypothetical protein
VHRVAGPLPYDLSHQCLRCANLSENQNGCFCAGLGGGAARVVLPGGGPAQGTDVQCDSGKKRKAEADSRAHPTSKRRQSPEPEVTMPCNPEAHQAHGHAANLLQNSARLGLRLYILQTTRLHAARMVVPLHFVMQHLAISMTLKLDASGATSSKSEEGLHSPHNSEWLRAHPR